MKRVCLVAEDNQPLLLALERTLKQLVARTWPDVSSDIQFLSVGSCQEGLEALEAMRGDPEVRLVLVTDYDLDDGWGSDLIQASQRLGIGAVWQLLQSGTERATLLRDPVIRGLREDQVLEKSVSTIATYSQQLVYFARVWDLPLPSAS